MRALIISSIDWNDMWQRHQTFANGLAELGWNVTFLENTGFRNPRLHDYARVLRKLRGKVVASTLNPHHPNVDVISRFALPPNGRLFKRVNSKLFARRIASSLPYTEYDVVLLYLPTNTSMALLDELQYKALVFDCVANFEAHPEAPNDFPQMLSELLRRAQMLLTDGGVLYRLMKDRHPNVHIIHQGVPNEFFIEQAEVQEYRTACYFGSIDSRMDWGVIRAIVDAGIEVHMYGNSIGLTCEGVTFHGPIRHKDLPRRIANHDILLIPYKRTEFNDGIIPAKIFECLATGKPTFVSALPYVTDFKEELYICHSPEEFVAGVLSLKSVESQSLVERRRLVAMKHSTSSAVAELDRQLRVLLKGV
ncbi:glycosyltransferase family protein [Alicyclobacillus suci]|uniref:glycosyltransferase family protein n=1 Tax=Alicyclobacillus suci TaxID=2816080 RepID=UPI001A8FACF3|nr:hypothetical protein [Alicyclobacillus suci]